MQWSDIASAVGKAAPLLGTALGGPLGGVAGALIASALGTSNDADSVHAAIAADPAALEKLQESEMANKVQMQQLVMAAEANRLADVQNARARQTANPRDYTPQFLAAGVTLGFFGALGAVMLAPLTDQVHDLLLVMIGALQTAWVTIVSYYFGSSKESAGQVKMIGDAGYAAAAAPINVHTNQGAPVVPQSIGPSTLPDPSLYRGS